MVYNPTLKREIPEGWEVKKIGEVATAKAGGDKPKIYSIEKTETCPIPIYSNGINNDGLYGFTNESTVNSQSVTISARGTIGYSALRNKPFVPIIRLIVLTPHVLGSANYFYEYLKTIEFEKSGSVQQQLTVPQVSDLNILYPPVDILKIFQISTYSIIRKVEILKEQNLIFAELRNWLLPMLMNGQITVK
jgi:type I restriction enzyme S subunit